MKNDTVKNLSITTDTRKTIVTALLLAGVAYVHSAQAATLNFEDRLTITPGVYSYDTYGNTSNVVSGSWFGLDELGNYTIGGYYKTAISTVGAGALVVGTTQAAGTFDSWTWGGFPGTDKTTVPVGDSTTAGLNLSGWTWIFNSAEFWAGSGAWTPLNATSLGAPTSGYTDGLGLFSWDGVYGHSYQVWYTATIPNCVGPSCTSTHYMLYLTGTVEAAPVPVPATAWLFGSGLLGLFGIGWRQKA